MFGRRAAIVLLAGGAAIAAVATAVVMSGGGDGSAEDVGAASSTVVTDGPCSHQEGLFDSRLGRLDIPTISSDAVVRLTGAEAALFAQPILGPASLCTIEPLEQQVEILRRADARFDAGDTQGGRDILEEMLSLPVEALAPYAVLAAGPGDGRLVAALASPRGDYFRKRAAGFVAAQQRLQERGGWFDAQYEAAAREAFKKYVEIDVDSMDLDEAMEAMVDAAIIGADEELGALQRRAATLANEELERLLRAFDPCPPADDMAGLDAAVAGLQEALAFAQLVGAQELPEQKVGDVEAALRASLSCEKAAFRIVGVAEIPGGAASLLFEGTLESTGGVLQGQGTLQFVGSCVKLSTQPIVMTGALDGDQLSIEFFPDLAADLPDPTQVGCDAEGVVAEAFTFGVAIIGAQAVLEIESPIEVEAEEGATFTTEFELPIALTGLGEGEADTVSVVMEYTLHLDANSS